MEEVEILRRRAKAFLKYAREALERGDYDFAAFVGGQAARLYLKSVMLEQVGEVSRTRWVGELLPQLLEAVKSVLPDAEAYTFGSAARGELTASSDVDVLVVSESTASPHLRDKPSHEGQAQLVQEACRGANTG